MKTDKRQIVKLLEDKDKEEEKEEEGEEEEEEEEEEDFLIPNSLYTQ